MTLKILLVDPSNQWLESTQNYLTGLSYETVVAQNGKKAQLALYNGEYFAVILNLAVQNHSGLEVLKFIRSRNVGQRIVVVLDNDDIFKDGIMSVEKLIKLGATEVMIKPFVLEQLKDVLEGQQSINDLVSNIPKLTAPGKEVEVQESDNNFSKVKIDEFYTGKAILFDVYIRLGSNKYVKILFAGDSFTTDRLEKYKKGKGVEFLFFHHSDRRKYVQYCNYLAKKIMANDKVSGGAKVKMMKATAEKLIEEVYSVGLKPQVVEEGKQLAQNMFQLLETQPDLFKVMREFHELDPNSYTHAYAVTLFTTAIIKQFDWQSKAMIETAALACLFHDIGKTKLPKELMDKDPQSMTQEELEIYQKHPEYGGEILSGNIMVNQNIRQIVIQHHEYFDGTGFPNKLKGNKVLTIANILALADDFVHMMKRDKTAPPETLKKILSNKSSCSKYNSLILENFIKVFVDPEKISKNSKVPSNSRMVPKRQAS